MMIKMPSKKIVLAIVGLVVICSFATVIVVTNRKVDNKPTASSCSSEDKDSIYSRAIDPIGSITTKESMDKLAAIKTEIENLKDFNKDSNCLYILTIYSTFYAKPDVASYYYAELKNNYLASPLKSDLTAKYSIDEIGILIDNQKKVDESLKNNIRFIR